MSLTFEITPGTGFYNNSWSINVAGRVSGVNVDFTTNSTDCSISGTLGGVNLGEQNFATSGSFYIESGKINNTNGNVLLTLTLTDNTSENTTVVTQNIEFHVNTLSATITKPDWLSDDRLNADEADTDLALTFNASNATSYIVLVNADGNGYSEIEIGGNITDNSTTIQIPAGTFNSDGTDRGIRVIVSDEFANPSSTAELLFIVDTTPPEFDVGFSSSTFPTHEGEWTVDSQTDSTSQNVVTGNVSGAVGDVTLELTRDTDNQVMFTLSQPIGDPQPTQITFTISAATLQALANGEYTLTITASDDAGNSEHDTQALIVNRDVTVQNQIVGVELGPAAVTGGDPYVTTLSGITYKLDNICGVCRMLQGYLNDTPIVINAEMKKDSLQMESEMNNWCDTVGTSHAKHQRGALHNQSFYTRFLVKYGEETAIIDLEKGQMSVPQNGKISLSKCAANNTEGNLAMYSRDVPHSTYDLNVDGLVLQVKLFSNKQLRNQLAVLGTQNIRDADGYLIRPMYTKQCRVKKLGTSKLLHMAESNFKSIALEHFYTGSVGQKTVKKSLRIPRV